jgi:hypothetical protein
MPASLLPDNSSLQCPSARPEMPGSVVFGVIRELDGRAFVQHLAEPFAVTADILALAGEASPGEVFRFAAACATDACAHFDGANCRLAQKLVASDLDRVGAMPPCRIRAECRWFAQEGKSACLVCPLIFSENAAPAPELAHAADPRS